MFVTAIPLPSKFYLVTQICYGLPLATSHQQQIVYNRLKLGRLGPFLDRPFLTPQEHCVFLH